MPRDDAETRAARREAIRRLHDAGLAQREIGRRLGLHPTTVRFYLRSDSLYARLAEIEAQEGLLPVLHCHICGDQIRLPDVHWDHVVPRARGGTDDRSNLKPSHSGCNAWKGARLMEELAGLRPPGGSRTILLGQGSLL